MLHFLKHMLQKNHTKIFFFKKAISNLTKKQKLYFAFLRRFCSMHNHIVRIERYCFTKTGVLLGRFRSMQNNIVRIERFVSAETIMFHWNGRFTETISFYAKQYCSYRTILFLQKQLCFTETGVLLRRFRSMQNNIVRIDIFAKSQS